VVSDAAKHIGEPGLRIDAIQFGCLHQRVGNGGSLVGKVLLKARSILTSRRLNPAHAMTPRRVDLPSQNSSLSKRFRSSSSHWLELSIRGSCFEAWKLASTISDALTFEAYRSNVIGQQCAQHATVYIVDTARGILNGDSLRSRSAHQPLQASDALSVLKLVVMLCAVTQPLAQAIGRRLRTLFT